MPKSKVRKKTQVKTVQKKQRQGAAIRQNRRNITNLLEMMSELDKREQELLLQEEANEMKETTHDEGN